MCVFKKIPESRDGLVYFIFSVGSSVGLCRTYFTWITVAHYISRIRSHRHWMSDYIDSLGMLACRRGGTWVWCTASGPATRMEKTGKEWKRMGGVIALEVEGLGLRIGVDGYDMRALQ